MIPASGLRWLAHAVFGLGLGMISGLFPVALRDRQEPLKKEKELRVWGLGGAVWGFEFRSSGFGVWGLGSNVWGLKSTV